MPASAPPRPINHPVALAKITLEGWLEPFRAFPGALPVGPFKMALALLLVAMLGLFSRYLHGRPSSAPSQPPTDVGIQPSDYLSLEWPPIPSDVASGPTGLPLPWPNPRRETPATIRGSAYQHLSACLSAPHNPNEPFACIPKGGAFQRVGAEVFLRVRSDPGFAVRAWGETGYTTESLCRQISAGIRGSRCSLSEMRFERGDGSFGSIPFVRVEFHSRPARPPLTRSLELRKPRSP
jgi:hypothetical protein